MPVMVTTKLLLAIQLDLASQGRGQLSLAEGWVNQVSRWPKMLVRQAEQWLKGSLWVWM